ncbi:hypothetical protein ID866_7214 [Astraeus odoratus]|nr:hypothetical protein ID866_7214 [Astraeus odoratus]
MAGFQRLVFGKPDAHTRTSEGYRPVASRKPHPNTYIRETPSTTSLSTQHKRTGPPIAAENGRAVSDIHYARPNHHPQTSAHDHGLGSYPNQNYQSPTAVSQNHRSALVPTLTAERAPHNQQGWSTDGFHAKALNTERHTTSSATPIPVPSTAKDISRSYIACLPTESKVQALPSGTINTTKSGNAIEATGYFQPLGFPSTSTNGPSKAREPPITTKKGQMSNPPIYNSNNYKHDPIVATSRATPTRKQALAASQTNKQPAELTNTQYRVAEVDELVSEDVVIACGNGANGRWEKLCETFAFIYTPPTEASLVWTNHTKKSDREILRLISDWLCKTYKKDLLLSGLLYFHRISDNRMAGTPFKNLRVFQKMCGDEAMSQIVLTTTMWDEVDEEVGNERLAELQGNYWKSMITAGSTTFRYRNTPESAKELIWQLVDKKRGKVELQKEIGDKNMEFAETEAAQELQSRLDQEDDLLEQYGNTNAPLHETATQSQTSKLSSMKDITAFIRRRLWF